MKHRYETKVGILVSYDLDSSNLKNKVNEFCEGKDVVSVQFTDNIADSPRGKKRRDVCYITYREGLLMTSAEICVENGHVMYPVYSLNNWHPSKGKSAWGKNKCSRCGYEEDWQYDY